VDKFNWNCFFSTPLVLESLISDTQLPVFRGRLNGSSVVVKMAEDDLCDELMLEAKIYQDLQPIQGSAVPTCHGVFSGVGTLFLLMDDVGTSPTSFTSLSFDQRWVSFMGRSTPKFHLLFQVWYSQITHGYSPAGSDP
jgi:hypothetical protein